jgi:hypothetical protein
MRPAGGQAAFVAGCVRLLEGDDSDVRLIQLLGGNTAAWALDPAREPEQRYWFRVWTRPTAAPACWS